VPTMGALHAGHLALVAKAKVDCLFTVVSIFVNPAQFGPNEDLSRYPRPLARDKQLLKNAGVDLLFCPSAGTIYPQGFSVYVEEGALSKEMCGKSRPGHFKGVCTVVAKLFNIVLPDIAYFGQKDYQQVKIIARMVRDLNFNLSTRIVPTVREKNGLAMSSRNAYLNNEERNKALVLFNSLKYAKDCIVCGERKTEKILAGMRRIIAAVSGTKIDYIEIRDADTLATIDKINSKVVIALAVFVGKTRLIDNIIVKPKGKI